VAGDGIVRDEGIKIDDARPREGEKDGQY